MMEDSPAALERLPRAFMRDIGESEDEVDRNRK